MVPTCEFWRTKFRYPWRFRKVLMHWNLRAGYVVTLMGAKTWLIQRTFNDKWDTWLRRHGPDEPLSREKSWLLIVLLIPLLFKLHQNTTTTNLLSTVAVPNPSYSGLVTNSSLLIMFTFSQLSVSPHRAILGFYEVLFSPSRVLHRTRPLQYNLPDSSLSDEKEYYLPRQINDFLPNDFLANIP